jgi:prepilin-type N-terminal cleavage/methylation domain-containing protein
MKNKVKSAHPSLYTKRIQQNTNKRFMLRNQKGFTLIEIITILVILGILAAVAIPKYFDIQNVGRIKAAWGQIAEVKGRMSMAMAGYMLSNAGAKPGTAAALVAYTNNIATNSCPAAATVEGDFNFICTSAGTVVTITVNSVQGVSLSPAATGNYTIQ